MSRRRQYRVSLEVLISADDETAETVERQYVGPRVSEMLAVLEQNDDIRIDLLTVLTVVDVP